jgi:hypothetical protein
MKTRRVRQVARMGRGRNFGLGSLEWAFWIEVMAKLGRHL